MNEQKCSSVMAPIIVGKNIRKTLFWEIEYFRLFYSCVSLASLYSFFSSLSMVNVCEVTKCHLFYLTPKLMLNFIPLDTHTKHPPTFFGRCYSLRLYLGKKHNSQAFCTHKTDDRGGWGRKTDDWCSSFKVL